MFTRLFLMLCLPLWLLACSERPALETPQPASIDRQAVGYFCGMIVADHTGPKSQIFLANQADPIWFTSVRDGIAFTLLPEESRKLRVFYVTAIDLTEWQHPEQLPGAWIKAGSAWYVINSSRRGGMGAPEAIPFSNEVAAADFSLQFGGQVVTLANMPNDYILGHGQTGNATDIPQATAVSYDPLNSTLGQQTTLLRVLLKLKSGITSKYYLKGKLL